MAENTITTKVASASVHARVVSEILIAIGARQDCRVWANNVGMARALTGTRVLRYGLVGSSDLIGVTSDGKFLGLEIKTGSAVQSRQQLAFETMVTRFGGRYRVVRSAQEAQAYLDNLCLPSLYPAKLPPTG